MDTLHGTDQRCPDYQGVQIFQVILYDEASFGNPTKCVDSVHINRFHCNTALLVRVDSLTHF